MKSKPLRDMTLIALFAAIISLTSFIYIPLFGVPVTLQTFGVFSALFILGGKRGTIAVAAYVALGAVGLPVFSGFTGGVGRLFDATGGFILGFIISSLLYWLLTAVFGDSLLMRIISALSAHIFLYLSGVLWFSFVYADGQGFIYALTVTVLPFLLPDAVKLALSFIICEKIKKRLK